MKIIRYIFICLSFLLSALMAVFAIIAVWDRSFGPFLLALLTTVMFFVFGVVLLIGVRNDYNKNKLNTKKTSSNVVRRDLYILTIIYFVSGGALLFTNPLFVGMKWLEIALGIACIFNGIVNIKKIINRRRVPHEDNEENLQAIPQTNIAPIIQPKEEIPPLARSIESNATLPTKLYHKLIDLNTASEDDIAKLPGVGAILAKRAIAFQRNKNGFESVEHFAELLGLDSRHINLIKPLVTISPIQNNAESKEQSGRIVDF